MSYIERMPQQLSYDVLPAVLQALELISQGDTETKACDLAGIAYRTLKLRVAADKELQIMYEEALHRGADAMADALLDPFAHKRYGFTDPKQAKVMSDNIKWYLGKRFHKIYGEKLEIKQETTVTFAITDALERARQRSQEALPPASAAVDYVDVQYEMVTADDDISELLG